MAPKRFFLGFLAGFGVALAVFFVFFYRQLGAPTVSSQWCWDINTRKQQLAEAAGTPKLLLVGGSSTLFGLSAKEITARTGFPTVNMGTHAALGPEYILHLARKSAKPGDTVLLALEYEAYDYASRVRARDWNDALFFDYIFARDPDHFRSWPVTKQLRTAMLISTRRLKEGLRNRGTSMGPVSGGIYGVSHLNAFGDQTGNRAETRPAGEPWLASKSQNLAGGMSRNPTGLDNIRRFIRWARQNEVRVLATFPTICFRSEYESDGARRTVKAIKDFYASEGVPVLGDAGEAMLPPTEFYDTLYHPTEEGAVERTRRLLAHLEPVLKSSALTANSAGQ